MNSSCKRHCVGECSVLFGTAGWKGRRAEEKREAFVRFVRSCTKNPKTPNDDKAQYSRSPDTHTAIVQHARKKTAKPAKSCKEHEKTEKKEKTRKKRFHEIYFQPANIFVSLIRQASMKLVQFSIVLPAVKSTNMVEKWRWILCICWMLSCAN